MRLPRVMRSSMLVAPRICTEAMFYTLLGADVVIARGEWPEPVWDRYGANKARPITLELVDDAGVVITSIETPDFDDWWRNSALGHVHAARDERGWYLNRWRAMAATGSVTILNEIVSIKFENGTTESSWRTAGIDAPQIDPIAIAELTNQELDELRLVEDRVAILHMNNVAAIEREIKTRAGITQ